MIFDSVHFRAESAIAFSRLHPEAAKEIDPINPVNPVGEYFDLCLDNYETISIYFLYVKPSCSAAELRFLSAVQSGVPVNWADAKRWTSTKPIPFPIR